MPHRQQITAPCTCGSKAVINERRHAPTCKRRVAVETHEAAQQLRATYEPSGSRSFEGRE